MILRLMGLTIVYLVWIFRYAFAGEGVWTCFIANACGSGSYVAYWSCGILYVHEYYRGRRSKGLEAKVYGGISISLLPGLMKGIFTCSEGELLHLASCTNRQLQVHAIGFADSVRQYCGCVLVSSFVLLLLTLGICT